jgi:transcriptional regulator with XRE-family HTH domain
MNITRDELRERRKTLGISQFELAKKVGVSVMTLQLWERGAGTPKTENEERLKQVLDELEEKQLRKIEARRSQRN